MQQTDSPAHDVIARYLSGRLSDSEAQRFEDWWSRNPAAIHEIDRVARLQDGLHGLRERGELEPLLRRSWWSGTLRFMAMAASVGTLAVAAWFWQGSPGAVSPTIAALPAGFGELARRSPAATQYFMTLRSRDAAGRVVLPTTAAALHWRLLPDHTAGDGLYRVTLVPADSPDDAAELPAVPAAPDGFVDVYVDSRTLRAGQYRLGIAPATATPGASAGSRFDLVVTTDAAAL